MAGIPSTRLGSTASIVLVAGTALLLLLAGSAAADHGHTDTREVGHQAVDQGEATYEAAKFMLRSEEDRDGRDGPPRSWQDTTQATADAALAPALLEAEFPGIVLEGNAVNGSESRKLQSAVYAIPYGYLDGVFVEAGVTDFTGVFIVGFLEQDPSSSLPGGSVDGEVQAAFAAGHDAVDAAPALP